MTIVNLGAGSKALFRAGRTATVRCSVYMAKTVGRVTHLGPKKSPAREPPNWRPFGADHDNGPVTSSALPFVPFVSRESVDQDCRRPVFERRETRGRDNRPRAFAGAGAQIWVELVAVDLCRSWPTSPISMGIRSPLWSCHPRCRELRAFDLLGRDVRTGHGITTVSAPPAGLGAAFPVDQQRSSLARSRPPARAARRRPAGRRLSQLTS